MCYEEYEYCSKCPHCRIGRLLDRWRTKLTVFLCGARGHKLKLRWHNGQLLGNRFVYGKSCACGKNMQYFYEDTDEALTPGEVEAYIQQVFWGLVNSSAEVYSLLPKEPWKEEEWTASG